MRRIWGIVPTSVELAILWGLLQWLVLARPALALPSFQEVRASWVSSDSILLDRHGEPIHELRKDKEQRRLEWVAIGQVSPALIKALMASEDRRFFSHPGVDWRSMGRALLRGLTLEGFTGASTITMQLAALLDKRLQAQGGRKSLKQKAEQIMAALRMEKHWSKGEILEAYLNLVSFRGELQGIAAASRGLFGKDPHGLDQAESLILACLIRAPNSPFVELRKRASLLGRSLGWEAVEEELDGKLRRLFLGGYVVEPRGAAAPHVARLLLKGLPKGSKAMSSLDPSIQRHVTERLGHHLELLKPQNVNEGAALVVENRSGEILAYVSCSAKGARGSQVDGIRARRQVGSALKPFLYARALDERILTPASLLEDSPLDMALSRGIYSPKNFDNLFRGPVSVRVALASSLNIPAVRVLGLVGDEAYLSTLRALGLSGLEEPGDFFGPSLALGSLDVSLLELVNAYRTLANGGVCGELSLTPVGDSGTGRRQVFSQEAAFLVSDILSDREARSATFGLENPLSTRFWAAVKTGTSKDMRDNWCVGYTACYTVGVWVGNFSGEPMWNVSGISGAAPVWVEIMNLLHSEKRCDIPIPPSGLVKTEVAFPKDIEPPRQEWFLAGTEPHSRESTMGLGASRIGYPPCGTIMAVDPEIPAAQQKVLFWAEGFQEGMGWSLDGEPLPGAGRGVFWPVKEGGHVLALLDRDGSTLDQVSFSVRGAMTWTDSCSDHGASRLPSP
ncbi:MAG: penicillin-binding protein 1C [bacterium]